MMKDWRWGFVKKCIEEGSDVHHVYSTMPLVLFLAQIRLSKAHQLLYSRR